METKKAEYKGEYKLRVIGEKEPLFYSDLKVALDCQARYQNMGKYAILMRYNPETDDYDIGL